MGGEVARRPGRDHLGDIIRVAGPREQMVRAIERYETFRVARGVEDRRGVVDADNLVLRPVEDEERPFERADARCLIVCGQLVDEAPSDREGPPAEPPLKIGRASCRERECPYV